MSRDSILFLDLEHTIIETWHDPFLKNQTSVRAFIKQGNFSRFGVFSFAVYGEKDKEQFLTQMSDRIGKSLGIEFDPDLVLTIRDMMRCVGEYRGFSRRLSPFSEIDFFDFFTKDTAFLELARDFRDTNLTLVDDMVQEGIFLDKFRGNEVRFVPVDSLIVPSESLYGTLVLERDIEMDEYDEPCRIRVETAKVINRSRWPWTGMKLYAGTWDAARNQPRLQSGKGCEGMYYEVSKIGPTVLDGEASWNVGDLLEFSGGRWIRVFGHNTVTTVSLTYLVRNCYAGWESVLDSDRFNRSFVHEGWPREILRDRNGRHTREPRKEH